MDEEDELPALVRVQTYILYARRLATETSDLQKHDACLRVAEALEERARGLADMGYYKPSWSSSTR